MESIKDTDLEDFSGCNEHRSHKLKLKLEIYCSVPDQVHRLVFMHDTIVSPFFMEELEDTQAHGRTVNAHFITINCYIQLQCHVQYFCTIDYKFFLLTPTELLRFS